MKKHAAETLRRWADRLSPVKPPFVMVEEVTFEPQRAVVPVGPNGQLVEDGPVMIEVRLRLANGDRFAVKGPKLS